MRFPGLRAVAVRLLVFAGLSLSAFANPMATLGELPSDAEIKTILQNIIERDRWGYGIVVGIVDEQGTRIIASGKLARGDSPAVDGDTLFEIGSVTKTFTALLLEDMIQRGEMNLDDPVEKFLPASYRDARDPAWGVSKRLRVQFRLAGEVRSLEVNENETLTLPSGAEVVKALYGDLPAPDKTADVTENVADAVKNGASSIRAENALVVCERDLKVPAWGTRKITLRDLATHRSGLPRDVNDNSDAGLYDALTDCHLPRKPGRKVEYCNVGFQLLGQAIALKAGTNYEALLQQRICRPLGMDSTCVQISTNLRPRLAKSHGQENRVTGDLADALAPTPGAGAIRSSARDMLKYLAANLGLEKSPLTPLMESTHVPQAARVFGEADVALAWWIYHRQETALITHGGSTSGQQAFVGFDKRARRGVVVLANRQDPLGQAVQPLGMYLLHPPAERPVAVHVSPAKLDAYAGLYEFRGLPQVIMALRRDGDQLSAQFLNSAALGGWVPVSDTEFAPEWGGGARLKMTRNLFGRMSAVFRNPGSKTWRAVRVCDRVPEPLLAPMLEPLPEGECALRKDSDLQGSWKATARLWYWPFASQQGTLRVLEPSPGVFQAEFDFPESNLSKLPVSVSYHAPGVELIAKSGDGLFKGRINADRTKMTGHYIVGGRRVGTTLSKCKVQNAK